MLSGSRPRGSSSTPTSGNIGTISGSGPAWRGSLIPPWSSGEHQRREPAPRALRQGVGRAHRLEELDELLARRLLVPLAVALEEGEHLVDRGLALAAAEERRRQL